MNLEKIRAPTRQQTLAIALAATLFCLNSGCMVTKVKKLDVSKVAQPQQEHIVGVTTKKGEEVGLIRRAAG